MQHENVNENLDANKPLIRPILPRWWRVLPSALLMMIISIIDGLILNDLIENRYAAQYHTNSSSAQNSRELCLNASSTTHQSTIPVFTTTSQYSTTTTLSPDKRVQQSTARLNVIISLAVTIPGILTSILLGANSDRIGRKALIVLPFIGKVIRYAILIPIVYFNLSDLWIILATFFDGISGTIGLSILSTFAYVSDCTTEKNRTTAIMITDVMFIAVKIIPFLTIGIYLQHPNFIQSMLITFVLSVIGLIFSIFLQPESNLNVQQMNFFQQLRQVKIRETRKILQVYFVKREQHKQRSLIIINCAQLSLVVMAVGYSCVNYLYLYGAPFCFDAFGVSLTNVAQTVAMIILVIPCTLFVTERTDHLVLPILGCFAFMIQLVLFAIAKDMWMIYLAVCIASLFYVLTPIIRSRTTKLVQPNEYAAVFILESVLESGGTFAISAMANEIYRDSLLFFPGLVFIVFALFGCLTILLLLVQWALENRISSTPNNLNTESHSVVNSDYSSNE